jgi:glycosyltransferase involved in cell wall biosynthesis
MVQLQKICHITKRFARSHWGGTEAAVFSLSQVFQDHGIEPLVFTTSMCSRSVGHEFFDGIPLKRFNYSFPWLFLDTKTKKDMEHKGGNPLSLSMLWGLLREKDVELIHIHEQHRLGAIGRAVARFRDIPYVVTVHGGYAVQESRKKELDSASEGKLEWGKLFGLFFSEEKTLVDADAIICVGKAQYEKMSAIYPKKSIFYVPNGIDILTFQQADRSLFRLRYDLKDSDRLILCVSRIDQEKNQKILLETFAQLAKGDPSLKLALIGPVANQAYNEELISMALFLGVEKRVIFIPGLEQEDPVLASAYRAADLFVLPSHDEPFGMVILEAWAAGLPVIASNVGGIPGFTEDKKNIILFERDNIAQLKDAMQGILRDSSMRKKIAAGGLNEVKKYDWKTIAPQVLDIYSQVLKKKCK